MLAESQKIKIHSFELETALYYIINCVSLFCFYFYEHVKNIVKYFNKKTGNSF